MHSAWLMCQQEFAYFLFWVGRKNVGNFHIFLQGRSNKDKFHGDSNLSCIQLFKSELYK
jgi:hypothetical protein